MSPPLDPRFRAVDGGAGFLAQIAKATERFIATSGNPPPIPWFVRHWIPARESTLMAGPGGGGKSYLALQMQACSALALPWLGLPVPHCQATVGFYTEDAFEPIANRLDGIARHLGTTTAELMALGMRVLPRPSHSALIGFDGGRRGEMATTPAFDDMRKTVDSLKTELLILDNVADFLPVPSFDNTLIRQARRAVLDPLADEHGVTIVGLQNVTLTGLRATDEAEGSSGGLAWRDAFRSRLYLRSETADGDGDRGRTLCRVKGNNAPEERDAIKLKWADGVFVVDGPQGYLERQANDRWLLDAVVRIVESKRPYSTSSNKSNYLPKLMAADPDRPKRFAERSIKDAFERLVLTDTIKIRDVMDRVKGREMPRVVAVERYNLEANNS